MKIISVLEVNLKNIKKNILAIKSKMGQNQKFCLVVKADAYGLGIKQICKYCDAFVDYFAVSNAEEFLKIRRLSKKPILLLDPIYENIIKIAKLNGEFCVSNLESFEKILLKAKRNKKIKFKIHLAVNTGMNRFGFCDKKTLCYILEKIKKVQNIFVLGVFSHYFASNKRKNVKIQTERFLEIKQFLENKLENRLIIFHICASGYANKNNNFDMVRIGIGAYSDDLFETVKLKSKIIDFQFLKRGESAGYDGVFLAKKNTTIAVVAIGYGDGIFRKLAGRGQVLINGKFCKIVAVCMDSILVDATDCDCKICDEVILIGKSKENQIYICDFALWCDTIGYEILTHITKRVKRKYLR